MNARGIPPAMYWVLLLLSYLGTPPHDLAGGGVPDQGTLPGRVPPILTWLGGTWPGYPRAGYPPPGWTWQVPPPPGWTWQGNPPPPRLDLAGYPLPGVCPMAFWEMLQSIMGYGYPPSPPVDRQSDGQTRVKTLPSRRTTYAGGNKDIRNIHYLQCSFFFWKRKRLGTRDPSQPTCVDAKRCDETKAESHCSHAHCYLTDGLVWRRTKVLLSLLKP